MNLSTAIAEYLTAIAVYMQPSSVKSYQSKLKYLHEALGNTRLETISRKQIDTIAADYRASKSAATTRLFVTVVREFFGWCAAEELIAKSPAARLRKPRAPRRTPRAYIDPVIEQLLTGLAILDKPTWADRRNAALLIFILHTGLRRAEAASWQWQDVDINGYIRVIGKGDRERVVPINREAKRALRSIHRASGHVFCNESGKPLHTNSLDVLLKRWLRKHNLPDVGLHRLRHTFATRLLSRGVALYDIRDLLGHESVKTTEMYLSAYPERLRGAVDRLDRGEHLDKK